MSLKPLLFAMFKPTRCVEAPDVDILEMLLMVKLKKKVCVFYVIGFVTHVNKNEYVEKKILRRNTVRQMHFLSRDLRPFDDGGGKCSRGGKERSNQH